MTNRSIPKVEVPEHFNAAVHFVDRNLEEGRGADTAILYENDAFSYQDVASGVNRAGNALRELGVEIENRVVLLLPDTPELVFAFFGAIKIGAVPVPVNTLLTPEDYRHALEDSRGKVLITTAELFEPLLAVVSSLRYLRHVVLVGDPCDGELPLARHDWSELAACADSTLDAENTSRDDVAFWLYTSGTTGSPSAAVHLHHDMLFCLELYAKGILGIKSTDVSLSVAKMFFAYGLGNSLYCPFGVGATTILHPGRSSPEAIVGLINRHAPTLLYGVPTWYAAALQALDGGLELDPSSLRLCVSAGEPLSGNLYDLWLDRTGVHILDGIGTTEVLHIFLSNCPGDIRPGSTGKPVPGYNIKLVDDDGSPTPRGEIGNLMVRGDSICAGYWNRHDATRQAIEGEWIKTRDKYHVDDAGYFWYQGRTNDMLKVGGRWVSPAEVEAAVSAHPSVLECAVVGVIDEELLETPKAYIVLRKGSTVNPDLAREIQEFVRSRLAVYKYPREIAFVQSLPKTATGKIQRFRLRDHGMSTKS